MTTIFEGPKEVVPVVVLQHVGMEALFKEIAAFVAPVAIVDGKKGTGYNSLACQILESRSLEKCENYFY